MRRRMLGLVALLTACKVEPIEDLVLAEPASVELPSMVQTLASEGPRFGDGAAPEASPSPDLAPLVMGLRRGTEQTSRWLWGRVERIELPRWLGMDDDGGGAQQPPAPPTAHAPTPPLPSPSP
jgi:hypothetical protein